MLNFLPTESYDPNTLRPFLDFDASKKSDSTMGIVYLWDVCFKNRVCIDEGFLFITSDFEGAPYFRFPLGVGDKKRAVNKVLEYCESLNVKTSFFVLDEEEAKFLADNFEGRFVVEEQPDWGDYLYNYGDLKLLAGKIYHGQRNHINKFLTLYPDYLFKPYTTDLRNDADAFLKEFYSVTASGDFLFNLEKTVINFMLDNFERSCQKGGILYVGTTPIAITFGEIKGDTLYVHFEKALRTFNGSYTMINYCFINSLNSENLNYVNREEDMGDLGLRKAKSDLHPCRIVRKFSAREK